MNMVSKQVLGQLRQLETPALGLVQYTEEQCFHCPTGVLGFPEQTAYILLDDPKVQPFRYLQSIELPELSFLIIDPCLIYPQHTLQIGRAEVSELQLDNNDSNAIYVIASIQKSPQDTTLNFRGPLIFNLSKNLFIQVIDESQELKVPLFQK